MQWTPPAPEMRLRVEGLPPGARYEPAAHQIRFTPDSIQGGRSWDVTASIPDGRAHTVRITVRDTVAPPPPLVERREAGDGFERLIIEQQTDEWLAGAQAGRNYPARVMAPSGAHPDHSLPVRVVLHGYDGANSLWSEGWQGEFRVVPSDPDNTYWWGFSDSAEGPTPPYTLRRALHLLEWVLETYPAADPNRVYVEGASMGGAGALYLGLLHPRHFAWVQSSIGQPISRNHRPSRVDQLAWHWGRPEEARDDGSGEMSVWDRTDMPYLLAHSAPARDQALHLYHGKDDPLIHFGAVLHPSPLSGRSFYQALQDGRVGHLAVWDEGGHGVPDPRLGASWWQSGWNPIFDATSRLRRDEAFPAFFASSADEDPGDGGGNGRVTWSDESGYAGLVEVPGDTGWRGALAGAKNRALRWDSPSLVDEPEYLSLPIKVFGDPNGSSGEAGYPPTGDLLASAHPVRVGVALRRAQAFRLAPGEAFTWEFGAQSGTGVADSDGVPVVEGLDVTGTWTPLLFRRTPR